MYEGSYLSRAAAAEPAAHASPPSTMIVLSVSPRVCWCVGVLVWLVFFSFCFNALLLCLLRTDRCLFLGGTKCVSLFVFVSFQLSFSFSFCTIVFFSCVLPLFDGFVSLFTFCSLAAFVCSSILAWVVVSFFLLGESLLSLPA